MNEPCCPAPCCPEPECSGCLPEEALLLAN